MYTSDWNKAIADADAALRIEPAVAEVFVSRSTAYWNKKDFDRALADANEAVRLDPKLAKAYRNRGRAYVMKKDPQRAADRL